MSRCKNVLFENNDTLVHWMCASALVWGCWCWYCVRPQLFTVSTELCEMAAAPDRKKTANVLPTTPYGCTWMRYVEKHHIHYTVPTHQNVCVVYWSQMGVIKNSIKLGSIFTPMQITHHPHSPFSTCSHQDSSEPNILQYYTIASTFSPMNRTKD